VKDMKKNEILKDLNEIFKENINDSIDIQLDESLSQYIADSVSFIKIIVAVEVLYDIEFTDSELDVDNFTTVQSMVDFIYDKTK